MELPKNPLSLPPLFRTIIVNNWGAEGTAWLDSLPEILAKCIEKWSITAEQSVFNLSYNFVLPVTQKGGEKAVLKIGFPHDELFQEMEVLEALKGHYTVRLLGKDKQLGAMLLERIMPGTTLEDIQEKSDEEATIIAAAIIREMPVAVPVDSRFPSVADWATILKNTKIKENALPMEMIRHAQKLFEDLEATKLEDKLLHGDLHHGNILRDAHRGWLSIDPKGVIGDPCFNAARFLRNPYSTFSSAGNLEEFLQKRVDILSNALGVEAYRIAGWGYVDCMIGACWSIENNGGSHEQALRCAQALGVILPS